MLARTAEQLFWLARNMERADHAARLLELAGRMGSVRVDTERTSEWRSVLAATGTESSYFQTKEAITALDVSHFLVLDQNNPSSIVNCIENAHHNARAARPSLSQGMWNAISDLWQAAHVYSASTLTLANQVEFLDDVKAMVSRFHGVTASEMIRDDAFRFTLIGQFLERADDTARLLDVKYHVLLPDASDVGGVVDYYQWMAILRVLDARDAYRSRYRGSVEPAQVVELLIGCQSFPRALVFCCETLRENIDGLGDTENRSLIEARRQAHVLYSDLRFARADQIIAAGLHEYLLDLMRKNAALGDEIRTSCFY